MCAAKISYWNTLLHFIGGSLDPSKAIAMNASALKFAGCKPVSSPRVTRMPFSNSAAYIGHDFFWPIKAESRCKVIVHCAHSAIAYDDFIERESGLYRLALLLGFAPFGFGIWFGNRQALPLSSASNPQK